MLEYALLEHDVHGQERNLASTPAKKKPGHRAFKNRPPGVETGRRLTAYGKSDQVQISVLGRLEMKEAAH